MNQALPEALGGFLDALPDAVVVTGPHGKILAVNALVEKLFGYTRDELLGREVEVLVPERFRRLHVGDRQGYTDEPRTRPMGEGRELAGLRKDGSEFTVEISLSPMPTPEGTLVVSIVRDTTKRREAELKFRGLLESAPDGIVVVDQNGRIAIANGQAERMFGYEHGELIGQPIEVLVPEPYRRVHVGERELYSRQPQTRPMGAGRELTGRRKDGSEFPVEISLSPLETGQGRLITSIVRDISERREEERRRRQAEADAARAQYRAQQAEEAVRQRDEFLAVASHELRTPVTALQLHLQTLVARGHQLDERVSNKIQRSLKSAERLATLVERLLDVARLSGGPLELRLSDVRVDDAIKEIAERVRPQATEAGCSLTLSLECGEAARWDRLRFEQVVTNLLTNAFKFGSGHPVEVRSRCDGAGVVITVSDHGPGIPRADAERIFERFERASPVHHYGGLGLGLYISRQIVDAHGGTIAAAPTEGGGATFEVRMPKEAAGSVPARKEVS